VSPLKGHFQIAITHRGVPLIHVLEYLRFRLCIIHTSLKVALGADPPGAKYQAVENTPQERRTRHCDDQSRTLKSKTPNRLFH
jgi:hypothetical protein